MPPCFILSIRKYGSRVKWSNPEKGVSPSLRLGTVAIEKGAFGSSTLLLSEFSKCTIKFSLVPDECIYLALSLLQDETQDYFLSGV